MEHTDAAGAGSGRQEACPFGDSLSYRSECILVLFAAAIFLGCIVSPPSLSDDVDAVQAQIARNMLQSGDWVTARLDGVPYLEKGPLVYWLIAFSYKIFGAHDWAARIPVALSAVALCWLNTAMGIRETCGIPRGPHYDHLCWPVSLHPHLDS
jgi:4-amino-4-deoxy-L-arabinose transferase-like glycosyltransferase